MVESLYSSVLVNQQAATLPTHETNFELANRFSKFFNDKIDTLRTSFRIDANSDVEMEPLASVKLNNLISATSDEIRDVIASCPNKSCQTNHVNSYKVIIVLCNFACFIFHFTID